MALPRREGYTPITNALRVSSLSPSHTALPEYSLEGERFLETYEGWMDKPVLLALPQGLLRVKPDVAGMERRYNFLASTFTDRAPKRTIQGAYGEIAGAFILNRMVEEATGGEYTVIPTPPQLDVCGQRRVTNVREKGGEEVEKTADIMLGKVIEVHGEKAVQPIMLFDIKSSPRFDRTIAKIGLGVNVRLTPLPVGIFYLGGMTFQDATGKRRQAGEYLEQVIHPAVLENSLQWDTVWPGGISQRNSRWQLFQDVCQEALLSCHFTRGIIERDNWNGRTKQALLSNISQAEAIFQDLQTAYS